MLPVVPLSQDFHVHRLDDVVCEVLVIWQTSHMLAMLDDAKTMLGLCPIFHPIELLRTFCIVNLCQVA